jgi:PKD repeat protein
MNSYPIGFGKTRHLSSVCMALFVVIAFGLALVKHELALCTDQIPLNTPLNDLGPNLYQTYPGGLYTGKNQRPSSYDAIGVNIGTTQIIPRNVDGLSDPNGLIGVVSIGMCNAWMEFAGDPDAFIPRANPTADNSVNPKLVFVNGAQPGMDAPAWTDPNSDAWNVLMNTRLPNANLDPDQVQVIWLKEAWIFDCNSNPQRHCTGGVFQSFPSHASGLKDDLKAILLVIKQKFHNVGIVYMSPRTRAYSINFHNPEPWAYETGFAVKWTIQDVIAAANTDTYPWTAWGPYLWTNGNEIVSGDIRGRSDGLTWLCGAEGQGYPNDVRHLTENNQNDYVHPARSFQGTGVRKVSDQLIAFLKTDSTATPWFLKPQNNNLMLTVSADTTSGNHPLTVNFTATYTDPLGVCSQGIDTYLWNFDDGDAAYGGNTRTKIFPAKGTYVVRVTAVDKCGNNIKQTKTITVN